MLGLPSFEESAWAIEEPAVPMEGSVLRDVVLLAGSGCASQARRRATADGSRRRAEAGLLKSVAALGPGERDICAFVSVTAWREATSAAREDRLRRRLVEEARGGAWRGEQLRGREEPRVARAGLLC